LQIHTGIFILGAGAGAAHDSGKGRKLGAEDPDWHGQERFLVQELREEGALGG
jgi:hypothetical protein